VRLGAVVWPRIYTARLVLVLVVVVVWGRGRVAPGCLLPRQPAVSEVRRRTQSKFGFLVAFHSWLLPPCCCAAVLLVVVCTGKTGGKRGGKRCKCRAGRESFKLGKGAERNNPCAC
jgi:hypothetical protein